MHTLAFIGAGRVGQALARALAAAGCPMAAVAGRTAESAGARALAAGTGAALAPSPAAAARAAELVVIAVPDGAIAAVAAELAVRPGQVVLHTSGALDAGALAPAAARGAAVGSCHPLQTIADPAVGAALLRGAYFALEGDAEAVAAGRELALAVGGHPLELAPGAKALYHAAAVFASNYVVALAGVAGALWSAAGLPPETALPALGPLMAGSVANLRRLGLPAALTGPVDRGDAATVRRHLAALAGLRSGPPDLVETYRLLGRHALALARAKGLDPAAAGELEAVLATPARPKGGTRP